MSVVVEVTKASETAVKAIEAEHVKQVAEGDWEEVVGTALPLVVHFHAVDSKASEELAPRFAAVAEKFSGKARFVKVDRQANAGLAAKLSVSESPTVVFLQGGKEKGERLRGGRPVRQVGCYRFRSVL